jgi:glycine dehydrogenase subunit 1
MSWSYLPHTDEDRRAMLSSIGVETVEALFADVPAALRLKRPLNLPRAMGESELVKHLQAISAENSNLRDYTCFLGAGAYDHYIPSVVDHVILRSEFYTAYTQYQPEISQGYLQALWEYQSMICEITGMEVANASMYDGGTALAEAAMMACGATGRDEIVVSGTVHPFYREVLKTYGIDRGYKFRDIGYADADGITDMTLLEKTVSDKTAAVIIQSPNFFGNIEELKTIAEISHAKGVLLVASVDPISLGILESPGRLGADIVAGEGQSMGLPISFGGPYLGFFAATEKLMRKMPGRLIGQTADAQGRRGFVLTLQSREQHIRREKATSNICSNEALCALSAAVYLAAVGKKGYCETAGQCLQKAHYAYRNLIEIRGVEAVFSAPFFKEFVVRLNKPVPEVNRELLADGIIGGLDLGKYYPKLHNCMLICVTEKRCKNEIDRLVERMEAAL